MKTVTVNYDDEESLISALRGQQFLVLTLSVHAPPDTHSKIVQAAVKAGVPYIMPNSYGFDIFHEGIRNDIPRIPEQLEHVLEIEKLGASYVNMVCGHWYEWSLIAFKEGFGFDFQNKQVTFYDEGKTKCDISTWRQCGRALAALLSLPEEGVSPALADWKNKGLYISSFKISQRDMLDSIHRVTGSTDADWKIDYEPAEKRYKDGWKEMEQGSRMGFAKLMYARAFYPNGGAEFESTRGLANEALGLAKEDLDEATKRALDMLASGWRPWP